MKKFTFGYISHNAQIHARYLQYSLENLRGDFEVIHTSDQKFPAENYNNMLDQCVTDYLILTHQDVSFPPDLLTCVQRTIDSVPDFGVLGMVGADAGGTHRWSTIKGIYPVDTLDCCFVLIRSSSSARFDTDRFGEFHLYVEDYCAQMNRLFGRQNYTIHIDSDEMPESMYKAGFVLDKLRHHSATVSTKGYCWGRYHEFRRELESKWGGVKTT